LEKPWEKYVGFQHDFIIKGILWERGGNRVEGFREKGLEGVEVATRVFS